MTRKYLKLQISYHSVNPLPPTPTITRTNPWPPQPTLHHSINHELQIFQLRTTFLLRPKHNTNEILPFVVEDPLGHWEASLRT
jgi:hypothetical protein